MLIYLLWALSVRVARFLRIWMPTNILLDYLRTRTGIKRDGTAVLVGAIYLGLACGCAGAVEHGWPGWLYLVFWLCFWNAGKFLLFVPVEACRRRVQRLRAARTRRGQLRSMDAQAPEAQQHSPVEYATARR